MELNDLISFVRDGGPLGLSLLFGLALYQLVGRLEERVANLFEKLLDVTRSFQSSGEETATSLRSIADDIGEIRRRLDNLKR